MIIYLLKSGICLAILLAIYHVFLEKEKMHQFNRFYLIGSVLFSFLAPNYTVYTAPKINTATVVPQVQEVQFSETAAYNTENVGQQIMEAPIDYTNYSIGITALISLLLLIRFCRNLYRFIRQIQLNEKLIFEEATLVLVKRLIIPHTFLHYIFLHKSSYQKQKISKELLTHEMTHVKEKHSLDVLFVELLQILFWFNPLFIYLKKAIKLNHEYIADEKVLQAYSNTEAYQTLLLDTTEHHTINLASNFNYSLTKKRFVMMTKTSAPKLMLFKKLLLIPLLIGMTLIVANRVEAQEKEKTKETKQETVTQEVILSEQDTLELYKEYYFQRARFGAIDADGKKITKSYHELTADEKKKVLAPPSLIQKRRTPFAQQFESWKESSLHALWIDGIPVKNEVLKNYKYSSFSSYFSSFVHKNARSERFPQPHQTHLETHEYFKQKNKKRVEDYEAFKRERSWPKSKTIKIIIDKGGALYLDHEPVQLENLETRINSKYSKDEISISTVLLEIKYTAKVKLLDAVKNELRKTGLTHLSIKAPKIKLQKNSNPYNKNQSQNNPLFRDSYNKAADDLKLKKSHNNTQNKYQQYFAQINLKNQPPLGQLTQNSNIKIGYKYEPKSTVTKPLKNQNKSNSNNHQSQKKSFFKSTYDKAVDSLKLKSKNNKQPWQLDFNYAMNYEDTIKNPSKKKQRYNTKIVKRNFTQGKMVINGKTYNTFTKDGITKIRDKWGNEYNTSGKLLKSKIVIAQDTGDTIAKFFNIHLYNKKYYYPFGAFKLYNEHGKLQSIDLVKAYKEKNSKFERLKNSGVHYLKKETSEIQVIDKLYSELGTMYFRMLRKDKSQINRPKNPILPYIKIITENLEITYKLRSELTEADKKLLPPPPPKPLSKNATQKEIDAHSSAQMKYDLITQIYRNYPKMTY